mmetsp:Transcript_12300/g.24650  ORF Transcript_12300/g.24650 Transcript_12300/m.24650 type:complete len:97 (+) Transcript_12300:609-899(+)
MQLDNKRGSFSYNISSCSNTNNGRQTMNNTATAACTHVLSRMTTIIHQKVAVCSKNNVSHNEEQCTHNINRHRQSINLKNAMSYNESSRVKRQTSS